MHSMPDYRIRDSRAGFYHAAVADHRAFINHRGRGDVVGITAVFNIESGYLTVQKIMMGIEITLGRADVPPIFVR